MIDDAITVIATGSNITTGAASASVAIPNTAAGIAPNYIRVSCTAKCYVKIGGSAVAAAAGDLMLDPTESVILKRSGATHIAAIQQAAAGICNVVALEDL